MEISSANGVADLHKHQTSRIKPLPKGGGFLRAQLHRYVQDACWKSRVNDYILKLQDRSHCRKHLQLDLMPHYMSPY